MISAMEGGPRCLGWSSPRWSRSHLPHPSPPPLPSRLPGAVHLTRSASHTLMASTLCSTTWSSLGRSTPHWRETAKTWKSLKVHTLTHTLTHTHTHTHTHSVFTSFMVVFVSSSCGMGLACLDQSQRTHLQLPTMPSSVGGGCVCVSFSSLLRPSSPTSRPLETHSVLQPNVFV